MIPPEWAPALPAAAQASLVLFVGAIETGKTSLITAVASALAAAGRLVGVVDADVGQSEIGPPTTIGLGRVDRLLTRLADASPVALHFVGVTSPALNFAGVVAGAARMVEWGRRLGMAPILVDTGGLVAGDLGRRLKQAKIARLDPDLVIALQVKGECESILARYSDAPRPAVLRLPALAAPRVRSPEARRRHRQRVLAAYFEPARRVVVDLGQVEVRSLRGDELRGGEAAVAVAGMLAGVARAGGETLGVAVVLGLDPAAGWLELLTPVPAEQIAAVVVSREAYPG